MEYLEQVHLFATKWIEKFRDQKISYIELVDHYLADDCLQMDCGHAFSEKYGDEASSCDALNRIIDEVTDIKLLGLAIYSQWRYFNHWAYDAAAILNTENRSWFILALSRLALLSGENPFLFKGELRKISENVRMLILTFRTISLFDFLMTTKKSTSHDALRIVLVDFFCKDIKIDIHISP